MSEEKSYATIARDIYESRSAEPVPSDEEWINITNAVITEFLRRNGEPVAWRVRRWYEEDIDAKAGWGIWFVVQEKPAEDEGLQIEELYLAPPQPELPTVEDLEMLIAGSGQDEQDHRGQAIAVLERLRGKR